MAPPKQRAPGRLARAVAPAIVRAADGLARWSTRALGVESTAGREQIRQLDLIDLVAVNTELNPEERHIINKALTRSSAVVREVMVPRTEVSYLHRSMRVREALAAAQQAGHTRYPVADGSHDDVVGFVHLRDLIWESNPDRMVQGLAREVKRLPGSKPVLAALWEMRRERHTIAVVMDEYGGTAGIVTLEDLIEEIVGEIHDEYDLPMAVTKDVDGRLNLTDFADRTGLELPDGPYETVGGFIMRWLGRVPRTGDVVDLETHTLTVVEMDGRRVAKVSVEPVRGPVTQD